jgi:hypothetical protein
VAALGLRQETYVVVRKLREELEPFLEEVDELRGHLIQLGHVTIRVDVAEAGPDWVVDEQQIGKLVPAALVQLQLVALSHSIWTDLHQGAVLGAAAGAAIEPYHESLAIRKVTVLEEPEEEVAVVFRSNFNVPGKWSVE